MNPTRVILIGGGLAGLMAAIRVAELGHAVDLFSVVPVRRSHSVCAQGGINAAKNLKGEGDSTWQHFDDTVYGGDFLQNQPLVKGMCEAAPGIIDLLDRMGVTFNRTPEGLLDFRRFGGTLFHRTAFAGATTGQQLLYALDEQVRRFESEGKIRKLEGWMFVSAVLDEDGVCRGVCAVSLRSGEVRTFPADAIIVATGRLRSVFPACTQSEGRTAAAASAAASPPLEDQMEPTLTAPLDLAALAGRHPDPPTVPAASAGEPRAERTAPARLAAGRVQACDRPVAARDVNGVARQRGAEDEWACGRDAR